MQIGMTQIFWALMGLAAGGAIGYGFGLIQDAALRRNLKRQQTGELKNGWMIMPGSMTRVAYLMVALALVQIICPMLFASGFQWWVSGGVVLGYGYVLFRQLRERVAQVKK